jgi:Mlc titration factor MtfA (ptsG expression regulator)
VFWKRRRRERLRAQPFPPEWRAIAERNCPRVARLSDADRDTIFGHAQVLLAEKHFEGCGGLELTDEIRVTIAVQAARLLLNADFDYFPGVVSILVYPESIAHTERQHLGGGIWEEAEIDAAGLAASHEGVIILSWDSASRNLRNADDGHDVVLHEFAHALDFLDRAFDGTPPMGSRESYRAWGQVMQPEFEAHRKAVDEGRKTVLDPYAAKNPTEFFAVATEHFFGRPEELRNHHPAVYSALRALYGQDPAAQP